MEMGQNPLQFQHHNFREESDLAMDRNFFSGYVQEQSPYSELNSIQELQ
jgi:hypothetical protein